MLRRRSDRESPSGYRLDPVGGLRTANDGVEWRRGLRRYRGQIQSRVALAGQSNGEGERESLIRHHAGLAWRMVRIVSVGWVGGGDSGRNSHI